MKKDINIATLTKHLYIMIAAGIPLSEALESLADQTKNNDLKNALTDILKQITKGIPFAKTLRSHPRYFNDYFVSLAEIGEESGTLEENLKYLAEQLQKDMITKRKFANAMLYPGFVLFFAFTIGSGISIFVLPKLVDFFGAFDITLPPATRALLAFATFMKYFGVSTFLGIIAVFVILLFASRLAPVKKILDRIAVRLPFIGEIVVSYQVTRICRNLGTLLKSGVTIARSLEVTADSLTNSEYADCLRAVLGEIEKGKTLYLSIKKYKIFPDLFTKMVGVGEKSGSLDTSLLYLADFYDSELEDLTKNAETVIEPILLVVIGLIVGFLALAIITPIYQLTGSIGVTTGAP